MESLPGRLLIAGASLVDPNFRRTVVLVGEHTEEGALALPEHVSKVAAAAPTGQRDEVVEHVSFLARIHRSAQSWIEMRSFAGLGEPVPSLDRDDIDVCRLPGALSSLQCAIEALRNRVGPSSVSSVAVR